MIYLDNSSTTHKKPYSVKKESQKGLKVWVLILAEEDIN
jgi:hypothetical protein